VLAGLHHAAHERNATGAGKRNAAATSAYMRLSTLPVRLWGGVELLIAVSVGAVVVLCSMRHLGGELERE
jgi:hypothetical protein